MTLKSRPVRIGVVMDPIDTIKPKKDTTLAFMIEAQSRGWEIAYMTLDDLFILNGEARGRARYVKVSQDTNRWYEILSEENLLLRELDLILMRKDPPFDMEYIMATYILEKAESEGTRVINNPRALRDVNEKVFTAWFPQCCPPSLFTRSKEAIKQFLKEHQKIVIKPTGKMGGQSIFVINQGDPNTNIIIEEMTRFGTCYVQTQAYIPEIEQTGDKRIILIHGVPVQHGIARIPGPGDHRGNMAAGATVQGFDLNDRDRWICKQLEPVLKERGLAFVGIDIIGDYLTEINVTSPTGVREIDKIFHTNISASFLDAMVETMSLKSR